MWKRLFPTLSRIPAGTLMILAILAGLGWIGLIANARSLFYEIGWFR
jgi:hypothetical protein